MLSLGNHRPGSISPPQGKRRAWGILLATAALIPLLLYALVQTETSSSDVYPWFPDHTKEREEYALFTETFGPEDYWIFTAENGEDPEVIHEIFEAVEEANTESPQPLLRRIRTSADFLKNQPATLHNDIKDSLKGVFFDLEGRRSVVFAEATEFGFRNRQKIYQEIYLPIAESLEPKIEVKVMGPGFMGVMADKETRHTLFHVTPFTFLISSLFALLFFRNVRIAFIAIFVSGISALSSIALVYYCGKSLSHLLVVLPSLSQLLALSNSIHLIHYYIDSREDEAVTPRWLASFREGWRPTVAASITTAIGFLSLYSSSLPVVRSFSLFGAISVLLAMILVLAIVPAGLNLLNPLSRKHDWIQGGVVSLADKLVKRFHPVIAIALLLVLGVSFFGFRDLKTEIRTEAMFSEQSELKRQLRWFEQEFGSLQACQIMGSFSNSVPFDEQLDAVVEMERNLRNIEDAKVFSPFLATADQALARGLSTTLIEQSLIEQEVIKAENNRSHWLLTLYQEPFPDFSESETDREITATVKKVKTSHEQGDWIVTGTYRLFGTAQEILVKELMKTFSLAFLLITPCIIFFLRDLRIGLVATIGNVFPIAVFFGWMGFFGVRIDIATMVIASIAFGIAVDDTIHFLNSFSRKRFRSEESLSENVTLAYTRSGAAILKTTLILSGGMLAFLLSDFGPSRSFALFTAIVLVLAAVGDLLLLPALFRGPLARFLISKPSPE